MRLVSLPLLLFLLVSCVKSGTTPTPDTVSGGETTNTPTNPGEDPLASYAWHLENIGQKTFSNNAATPGEDMNIKEVHDANVKGSGIRIAISDTGVEAGHPDLSDNQLSNMHRNYSSDTAATWGNGGDPYPIEGEGHGTAVAGLAAAVGWNSLGSRGVAPSAQFAGFLFIGGFHGSQASYEAKILHQMNGSFDIFNYSYGYAGCGFYPADPLIIDAYYSGVTSLRGGKGAIYVKSAGNDYIGLNSDCTTGDSSYFLGNTNSSSEDQNHPYAILVGALNANGSVSTYSTPGSGTWVTAAGGEYGTTNPAMLTTDITGCSDGMSLTGSSVAGFNRGNATLNPTCDYTSIMNGTSSAAPVLSGIIALMLEANPNLTWRDVKHILATTATKIKYTVAALSHPSAGLSGHIYDNVYVTNTAGYAFSNTYGFGRVNAQNAVSVATSYVSTLGTYRESVDPITQAWVYDSGVLNLNVPDNSATGVTHAQTVTHNYFIESVQIKLTTDHTYVGDLGVELISPSGTKSRLLLINSNINHSGLTDYMLLTNAFYGETSAGSWTIKLIDGAAADTGNLISWNIKVNGHTP